MSGSSGGDEDTIPINVRLVIMDFLRLTLMQQDIEFIRILPLMEGLLISW
jgi:hypothetical protein